MSSHRAFVRRSLATDLAECIARAADLAYRAGIERALDIDLNFVHGFALGIASDHDIVRDMGVARIRDHLGDIVRDLDIVRPFVRDVTRDLDHDLDHGDARVLARTHVRDYARDLDRVLARAQSAASALISNLDHEAAGRAGAIDQLPSLDAAEHRMQRRESRGALRLTRLTARCLPSAHRSRYREEYAAELGDLAAISWRAQWCYAFNIVASAWVLRRDLRRAEHAPVPRRWLG